MLGAADKKITTQVEIVAPGSLQPGSRTVLVTDQDVVPIRTKLRFATVIVLPDDENIIEAVTGDKEFWQIHAPSNLAYIKPSKGGATTNLNLITARGAVYSFLLSEVDTDPDLKVFIRLKDESVRVGVQQAAGKGEQPKFVRYEEVLGYKLQADEAEARLKRTEMAAAERIVQIQQEADKKAAMAKAGAPSLLVFDYDYSSTAPFAVQAMFHDDRFTYIRANPQETPALYELKDGKPSLIQFAYHDGLYTVPKIVDRGYLAIGKARMHFTRKTSR